MGKRKASKKGFYETIEYIGPRPVKKRRGLHILGGWIIFILSILLATWIAKPLVNSLMFEQKGVTKELTQKTITQCREKNNFSHLLAAAMLEQTLKPFHYDPTYPPISYPNGDVTPNHGKSEDLVIRAYRSLNIDLQKLVHEDMQKNFPQYPRLFGLNAPDTNVDHRRAANLRTFFRTHGQELSNSPKDLPDFQIGDIVIWIKPEEQTNSSNNVSSFIGIVVPGPKGHEKEPWIVTCTDSNVIWRNSLLEFSISGHYRYQPTPP